MPGVVQFLKNTTAELSGYEGPAGELRWDETKKTWVGFDGETEGGFPMLREDFSNLPSGRLVIGDPTLYGAGAQTILRALFQSDVASGALVGLQKSVDASNAPTLGFYKSRGTGANPTIVQSGDQVLNLLGAAYDGLTWRNTAQIRAEIDGTPGAGDTPGRLILSTTPDGSTTLAERMRIDNGGYIQIGGGVAPSQQATVEIKALGASKPQLKLLQNNVTDDGWLALCDGEGGGFLSLQRRASGASTERMKLGTDGMLTVAGLKGPDSLGDVTLNQSTGLLGNGRGLSAKSGVLGSPASGWFVDFATNARYGVIGTVAHVFYNSGLSTELARFDSATGLVMPSGKVGYFPQGRVEVAGIADANNSGFRLSDSTTGILHTISQTTAGALQINTYNGSWVNHWNMGSGGSITQYGNHTITHGSDPEIAVTDWTTPVTVKTFANDANGKIGTSTNHPFFLQTNAIGRVGIDTSGYTRFYGADGNAYGAIVAASSSPFEIRSASGQDLLLRPDDRDCLRLKPITSAARAVTVAGATSSGDPTIGTTGGHLNLDADSTNTVVITGLPTSSAGLPTGGLYKDGSNFIKAA